MPKKTSTRSTSTFTAPTFGEVIRSRRRALGFTQDEVAVRIGTSKPYVAHLESGNRHPSDKTVARLAEVLGIDGRELFFLANPNTEAMLSSAEGQPAEGSVWDQFQKDADLQSLHGITPDEMEVLRRVSLLGQFRSPRDLIYILNAIRHAIGK
jgi:transcriptional regulator with XRE-family HTH domain